MILATTKKKKKRVLTDALKQSFLARALIFREHWKCLTHMLNFERHICLLKERNHTVITREGKWCESQQLPDISKSVCSQKLNMAYNFTVITVIHEIAIIYCQIDHQNSMLFLSSVHLVIIKIYFQDIV